MQARSILVETTPERGCVEQAALSQPRIGIIEQIGLSASQQITHIIRIYYRRGFPGNVMR
jgi:hypothetical protein